MDEHVQGSYGIPPAGNGCLSFHYLCQARPGSLNNALWWILLLGFSAWLLGRARQPVARKWFRITGQIVAFSIAVGSGLYLIDLTRDEAPSASPTSSAASDAKDGTIDFVEEDVLARIAADEAVFLEFTASWCTTCKVNQRVFRDPKVRALMQEKGVIHIKGDLTAYDETLTRWLADFGRAGVPLYVLYRPGEEAHLFPELITVDSLSRELERIGS